VAARRTSESGESRPRRRVIDDPEARENMMIELSMSCAEKQLREGKASSQVIVHFLKLGTKKAEMELEKLAMEKELMRAKTEQIEAEKKNGELYAKAIAAMGVYSGKQVQIDDEEDV